MGHPNAESIEKLMSKLATEAPKRYSHGELQSFTSNFSSEVGSGAFGKVYKGQFNDGVKIAVKVLLDDGFVAETFEAEVSTIGMTSHRYLVKLYGFCFDENMKALVYEYMENGSLNDILYGNRLGIVWEKFYSIAIGTAKGLSYLHDGCHKQIIHHDVKAANILLDANYRPKLADFGVAKLMNREDTHRTNTGMRGTMNYAAPEVCYPSFPITYKCDVYSFGMLLFEILGMRNNGPRENWFPKQVWKKFEIGQLDEFITDCGIPENSKENAKTLSMVAFWCAQWIPTRRPSMSTVVKMLEEEMPITTPPYPFYPSSESSMPTIQELKDSNAYSSISGERPSPEYSVPPMQEAVHSKVSPSIYSKRSYMAPTTSGSESPKRKPGLLRDQVQLTKKRGSDRYEIAPIQEPLSFEKGFFIVIRACQLLTQKNDGIIMVGVAGPSGAGKTVFTEKLLNFMPSIALLSMDNYNDASRIIDGNFYDPRLTDYDTLLKNIQGLKEGKPVEVPIYDFKTSTRTGYRTVEVPSSRIVVIEGIYALSEKLRPFLDLRVSVTGGVHFDLVKQVLRGIQHTGQEPEEIIRQIFETVYPMYKAFIEPDLRTAHIKITNKFNPFTGFQNPTYILKSPRALTMDQIRAVISDEHKETKEETYDIYLLPLGEDPEACQSYLQMRNRDGKYNLMFEEWVTDSPFIISTRITFEVSVRLLGGLMALGYTIAAILKRSSHGFSDDKVTVKVDWLEQLNRHYVQAIP